MGIKLNLTGEEIKKAQGGGFAPLPEATYGATVYSSEYKISKSSKNPMYQIDFKITEGPAGIGRRQRGWFVLSGKALFKVVELLKAVDFPYPNKSTPAGEFEFPDADEFLGIAVNIKLEQEEYASVATEADVEFNATAEPEDKILNSETGEPVTEEGEPVTKIQNRLARVLPYDPDRITTDEELEAGETAQSGGLFL
jgi:hypothetical protein